VRGLDTLRRRPQSRSTRGRLVPVAPLDGQTGTE